MNKKNIIVSIIVVLVVLIALWYLNGTGASTNTDTSLTSDVSPSESVDAQNISNLLQEMSQVKLDPTIFSNPVFQNLQDNTVTLSPQQSGRNNPFAPVGDNGTSVSTTTVNIKN